MDQMITQWLAHCVGKGERHWKKWKGCYSHLWDATSHTGFPLPQDSEARTQVQPFIWDPKLMRGVEMSHGREGSRKAG